MTHNNDSAQVDRAPTTRDDGSLAPGIARVTREQDRHPRRRLAPRHNQTYLVTGGAGFIGSHLVDALVLRGERVIIIDDLSTGRLKNIESMIEADAVEWIHGTVLDEALIDRCMREADVCVHLASAVGVQLVLEQPLDSLLVNVRGADIVLSAAARHGCRLLFASSSEVYGKNGKSSLCEDEDRILGSTYKTRWAYSLAKSFGETLALQYHREFDTQAVVVRLFNTVGARQASAYGMVLPRFVRQALRDEDLTVYGNGTQTRCFTHVQDALHAILKLCDAEPAGGNIYNVGSSTEVPVIELARKVIERTGSESTVRLIPYEQAFNSGFEELARRVPDTSALRELTGWTPSRDIDDAIDDVVAFERNLAHH
ncbi:MAG: NAD-dependent epimerase/dehydratase family protein [Solirubrobacteraceae bacterium]